MDYQIPGKMLYHEICGEADIFISEYGNSWIVGGTLDGKYVEKTFNPSPYPDKQPYDLAIACYDDTLNQASKLYKVERIPMEKPDFSEVTNL